MAVVKGCILDPDGVVPLRRNIALAFSLERLLRMSSIYLYPFLSIPTRPTIAILCLATINVRWQQIQVRKVWFQVKTQQYD